MFFLIPYAVDVPFDRKPVMNWLLVISVILAFGLQAAALSKGNEAVVEPYVLDDWSWQGLIGHMWLHADPLHLGGNMLFLWVFGNAVCSKVGNLKYPLIFLAAGLGAATAHMLLNGEPAIGASGAINGIVGMFLVFFWQNEMDCLFFIMIFLRPIYKTFSISSYWMIILWLIFDIIGAMVGGGQIAYFAHLGGFFAGAALAVLLLKLKLVTMYRDEQSLIGLVEQWRLERQDAKLEKIAQAQIEKAKQSSSCPVQPEMPQTAPAAIRFACPCGRQFRAPIQHAGRRGRCPICQTLLIIPKPEMVDSG